MKNKIALAVALGLCAASAATSAQAAKYVITANKEAFDNALASKVAAAGGTVTARLPQIGVAFVESNDPGFAARAAKVPGVFSAVADITLQFDRPVAEHSVVEDYANPPASGEDDNRFDLQWGSQAIDVAGAWNAGYRGQGAVVAVLDSGAACLHPDIAPNLLPASTSFVPGEGVCLGWIGLFNHGTHVAGIIAAADNGFGSIGVAPEAKILAVKVLSETTGSGSFEGILQGIVYAADNGADVINMSLGVSGGLPVNGGNGGSAKDVSALVNAVARAVRYARKQNVLVVASAGNDARDLDHDSHSLVCDENGENCFYANLRAFPAEVPGVLAVSATTPVGWAIDPSSSPDYLASYSNYGQSAISFAAPGGDTPLAGTAEGDANCTVAGLARACYVFDLVFAPGGYGGTPANLTFAGYWTGGTSMAAPHVSGVAALIIGKHGGEMAPADVERILRKSAEDLGKPGNDDIFGGGRVNAARAVAN